MLFTADLRSFADRLAATKKVEVQANEDKVKEELEIKTNATSTVALKVPDDGHVKVKVEDTNENTGKAKGQKRKKPDAIIHASQTTETRRMSKRLRSR